MKELLSFPGLGLEFNINRVAFSIGPVTVYWYGILIAIGLLLATTYAMKRSNEFGINSDKLMDILLIGTIGSIIGARAYYVIFSWDMFKDDLMSIFKTWEGGIAIYGGIIGAIVVGCIVAKMKNVKILPLTDIAFTGFLLGQGIGRWGNFINIEAFGSNTTMPWGMTSQSIVSYLEQHQAQLAEIGVTVNPQMPVHPTFLYESLWCLLGFAIVALYTKRRRFDGEITLFYMMWYGSERFVVEGLRTDSLMMGGVRVSQVLAGITVLIAVAIMVYIRVKIKKANDENYLIPFGKTAEGLAIGQAERESKKK
ncbi:MAG: prolipoprotein diacylglyceryl transferase [Oscillospiraceae bacterium]